MSNADTTQGMAGGVKTLRDDLSRAGREMWLASLGAMATVEEETRSVFHTLVEKGKTYESRAAANKNMVERAMEQAAEQLRGIGERVETGLQDTSKAVLHRFGVPSHTEIEMLIKRVEQLTAKVEAISKKEAADAREG